MSRNLQVLEITSTVRLNFLTVLHAYTENQYVHSLKKLLQLSTSSTSTRSSVYSSTTTSTSSSSTTDTDRQYCHCGTLVQCQCYCLTLVLKMCTAATAGHVLISLIYKVHVLKGSHLMTCIYVTVLLMNYGFLILREIHSNYLIKH